MPGSKGGGMLLELLLATHGDGALPALQQMITNIKMDVKVSRTHTDPADNDCHASPLQSWMSFCLMAVCKLTTDWLHVWLLQGQLE